LARPGIAAAANPLFKTTLRTRAKSYRFAVVPPLVAIALAFASAGLAQKSKASKKHGKAPAAPAAPVAAPVPFLSGEILEYRVLFSKYQVNAAKIETSVVEERNFFGHLAWHFRAMAHTMDTTRALFAIDDQFDSYTSAANLFCLQFEMYLHEQGKAQTNLYRMTAEGDPAPADATATRVPPGTRDAIGFLYILRAADWQHAAELRAPVFDGHRIYDVVARIDTPQGIISVPAGNFPAFRVALRLFDHGKELTDTKLWVWFSKEEARTPVLVEAEIPFGTARIELAHMP
jgi:hypothetical protein